MCDILVYQNESPNHVIHPIGGFKLVINLPGLVLAVPIVAKCKEIINLAQKILTWRREKNRW